MTSRRHIKQCARMATPLMVLVGAGVNPNLLTTHLTNELVDWSFCKAPTLEPSKYGLFIERPTGEPLFRWLRRACEVDGDAELNFEDLIHILELISSNVSGGTVKRGSFKSALFYPTATSGLLSHFHAGFVAALSCIHVLRRVLEVTKSAPQLDAELLLRSMGESNLLRVFSLNYDSLITRSTPADWWTGFQDGVPQRARFTGSHAPPRDRHLNIQLHGSIHFATPLDPRDTRFPIERFELPSDAEPYWDVYNAPDETLDLHTLEVVPMITGRRKSDKILGEPFASYFHYFRDVALTTPRWLILGYGGGDPHVNGILQTAAEKWGDELRVAVCNYAPYEVPEEELFNGTAGQYVLTSSEGFGRRLWGPTGYSVAMFGPDIRSFFSKNRLDSERVLIRAAPNKLSERLLLTLDGNYLRHAQAIKEWLM